MRQILKRKSSYTNEDVDAVWHTIESFVTRAEAEQAVATAAAEVQHVFAARGVRRPVMGWSGGKDSQALRVVVEQAGGISHSCAGIVHHLEFPRMLDWMADHAPDGLVTISNDELTLPWLAGNQKYLFPEDSKLGFFWTMAGTRRAQHLYQARYHPDLWLFGRRRIDNNWISPEPFGIHTDQKGMTQYSPIRGWSHELTLAVCHYYATPMPPIYNSPDGWVTGTGPWPGRRPRSEAWGNTWAIDPEVVRDAARFLPAAATWMNQNGYV